MTRMQTKEMCVIETLGQKFSHCVDLHDCEIVQLQVSDEHTIPYHTQTHLAISLLLGDHVIHTFTKFCQSQIPQVLD